MTFDSSAALQTNTDSARTSSHIPPQLPEPWRERLSNDVATKKYDPQLLAKSIENSIREFFNEAVGSLIADTQYHSSISEITRHEKFAALVDMDRPALELILEEMAGGNVRVLWFPLLKRISKHDPVPVKDRGNVQRMARAWIDWGKKRRSQAS